MMPPNRNGSPSFETGERGRDGAREKGFTLLEVTLALMLIVILMGGIYSIATGAIQLGAEVSEAQNREMLVHSFLQLCRRNIESLPGNSGMTLLAEESGRYYVTEVAFINAPLAFSFAAVPAGFDKAVLKSEADPRGYLRVNLLYLNEEDEESLGTGLSDEGDGITLPLLDGVSVFEWRFYDQDTDLWEVVWEDETKRPSFVELTLGFFDGRDPIRTVFWLPPVANPEQVINAAGGGGGAGGGGAGGQGGGGQGGGGGGGDGRGRGDGPGDGRGRGNGGQGGGFPGGGGIPGGGGRQGGPPPGGGQQGPR